MTTKEKRIIHIGIEVPENSPDIFIEKISEDIRTSNLIIETRKRPETIYAAAEWIIPTAIAAYIFKPYFEGFLQEAGKDHYIILKNWLKKLSDIGRVIKFKIITSNYSSDKLVNQNSQSKTISLFLQTKNDRVIKLLFDNDLYKEDWDNAIDQFLEYAIDHYEKYPNDRLTIALKELDDDKRFTIYAIIDKNSKQIVFFDNSGITQKIKGKKK